MSSHREAPEISKDPVADSTDLYAFVSPDQPDTVTLIANYITPYAGPASRSYRASNATSSPRATWTSRSSRSRSPLLSVDADLNGGASESLGFT